jgi:hypothetical protein
MVDPAFKNVVADFLTTRQDAMGFTYSIEVKNIPWGKSSKKGVVLKTTKDMAFVKLTRK